MSNRYTADGKRRSSMSHARRAHGFTCGRLIYGNGAAMHARAHGCRENTSEWTITFLGAVPPVASENPHV